MTCYEFKQLSFTYPEREYPALQDISLKVEEGEFLLLCGKSGCGKTTLLRHLKTVLTPHGSRTGEILFHNTELSSIEIREQTERIGYVLQSPENQIVTDKVWHELAFGLESLGYKTQIIRRRVAEMASFFGIQDWFLKNVTELSGGQKQLLNLAAVMAMQPEVLILDEPTSQLDPIAAGEFLGAVKKINRDLGMTVIISEQRLEEVFPLCDRAVVMDAGKIISEGSPRVIGRELKKQDHEMFLCLPATVQIHTELNGTGECPLTVREGRQWLIGQLGDKRPVVSVPSSGEKEEREKAVCLRDVWFRYEKNSPDVVKDLSLTVFQGELFCIVGGNGTGKTTALHVISGLNSPYRGSVKLWGKDIRKYSKEERYNHNLGVLPQNPQSIFVRKTVALDLEEILSGRKYEKAELTERIQRVAEITEIDGLLSHHPYDLSGGEQQRAALAKVLLLEPRILLLDEPTKGMDGAFKQRFAKILKRLTQQGVTVIMVSHDIEFCAEHSDRCAMFFDGNLVSSGSPTSFFSGNSFYTTLANRMSRGILENTVTSKEVVASCRKIL